MADRRSSARRTLATTRRVLTQLRRDPRTLAPLLLVPVLLLVLLRYVVDDHMAPALQWLSAATLSRRSV